MTRTNYLGGNVFKLFALSSSPFFILFKVPSFLFLQTKMHVLSILYVFFPGMSLALFRHENNAERLFGLQRNRQNFLSVVEVVGISTPHQRHIERKRLIYILCTKVMEVANIKIDRKINRQIPTQQDTFL
jgi:hypothetical protein